MYFQTSLHVASLRQLSVSYWQLREAPWPCCYVPDSRYRSCFRHWEVLLNVDQVSLSLIGQWISPFFLHRRLQLLSRATMQDSVECAGTQKHSGKSPVFIHWMVLEIWLFFLILYSRASCFVEESHSVEDIQNNGCISRTIQCINTGFSPLCFWGPAHSTESCTVALSVAQEAIISHTLTNIHNNVPRTNVQTLQTGE